MPDFGSIHANTIEEVVGNRDSVTYLKRFASDVDKGIRRRPILIYGPPGIGKTVVAHILAEEHGWNIIEMNASDYRDEGSVERRLNVSSKTRSLFGKINVLLLDEIDELSGRYDEGAARSIGKLISESKSPIIIIANNMWDRKISFLRGKTDNVEFKKLPNSDVVAVLKNVAGRIDAKVSANVMEGIAGRSAGDARSAINDLLVMVGSDDEMLESIGMRDRKSDIFSVLDKIFNSNTVSAPLRAMASSDVDNEMLIKWIDENIPYRYNQPDDLHNAYVMLSDATLFSSRASRKQYYTYWRYMNVMMSSGVALSKSSYPDNKRRYSFPKVISSLSSSKESRGSSTELARKLQKMVHQSLREIKSNTMPLMADMARLAAKDGREDDVYGFFASRFDMSDKEVKALMAFKGTRLAA